MQPSVAEIIRQTLEDEIASGLIVPGSRLEELALADRFCVSRTPVREALRMLSASGLVELKRGKGAVVATLGVDRLLELFEVMSELEGVCGRLAARRLTNETHAELLPQHRRCGVAATAQDAEKYDQENAAFHSLIYAAACNRYLADEIYQLRRRLQPYRRLQLRSKGRIAESVCRTRGHSKGNHRWGWRDCRARLQTPRINSGTPLCRLGSQFGDDLGCAIG